MKHATCMILGLYLRLCFSDEFVVGGVCRAGPPWFSRWRFVWGVCGEGDLACKRWHWWVGREGVSECLFPLLNVLVLIDARILRSPSPACGPFLAAQMLFESISYLPQSSLPPPPSHNNQSHYLQRPPTSKAPSRFYKRLMGFEDRGYRFWNGGSWLQFRCLHGHGVWGTCNTR